MATVEEQVSPKSPCLEPGCRRFSSYRGRCEVHSTEREQQINRAGKKVYATKKWAMTRRRKLSQDPMCERCGKELADTVHHIEDIGDEPEKRYRMDNLEALCASCHSRETRARQLA